MREPIELSPKLRFCLDNLRTDDELQTAVSLLETHYHTPGSAPLPLTAPEGYASLETLLSEFRKRIEPEDHYVAEVLSTFTSTTIFECLAKMWIVARYDDEGQHQEMQREVEEFRKKGEKLVIILDDDNPIVSNSEKLRNYLSLVCLLVHSEGDSYFGGPILITSEEPSVTGHLFDSNCWRNALVLCHIFLYGSPEQHKTDQLAWAWFPYVKERLIEVCAILERFLDTREGELLLYVGNILRVVQHDVQDIKVRFLLLVSLLELLLTHNPNTTRFNVEDSISRQFRLKTGMVVHLQHPHLNLSAVDSRLKQLYKLRSAVAHGDFQALRKYQQSLSNKKEKEQYLDDIVADVYFYLRAVMEKFLEDPEFIRFVKSS